MTTRAVRATLADILPLRLLFLQESNCQIRYDACHARGWSDSYLLQIDEAVVGYGAVKGQAIPDRDTIFEFFVVPPFRSHTNALFGDLLSASGASFIECQSNDASLSPLLATFAQDISSDVILFADDHVTEHAIPGALVRPRREEDSPFEHAVEPVGDYVLELGGDVVATAGFLLHYNPPFADLFMEVTPNRRQHGYGTFILQEVKKACYLSGRVPAARCDRQNVASKATLLRAGMRICGEMRLGRVTSRPPL